MHQFVEILLPLPNSDARLTDAGKVYTYVSQMPALPDGSRDFPAAIGRALRYSDAVRRKNIAGIVAVEFAVEFAVEAGGLVRRPCITRPLCVSCDQAVRWP
ncbi:hypothetical protein [Hymenobacter nivis]|uniref:Uncharacterized protein n=1 Tax=Hymenobacter nivis TaxID=1850093 RepID=A0A2Z3GLH9_9BACT|nr:hypothetical protein [Hymenobacter nivis]AWM32026.1 hypothetical protein DDQ68_03975 [Hymenobacter nivis]